MVVASWLERKNDLSIKACILSANVISWLEIDYTQDLTKENGDQKQLGSKDPEYGFEKW